MSQFAKTAPETQRVRGNNLSVLFNVAARPSFQKALERADAQNLVLAPNWRMDRALVGSNEWHRIREGITCYTGTIAAHTKPGKPLGEAIMHEIPGTGMKIVFPVPSEFRHEKNAALVAEHPDYKLVMEGKNRVVVDTNYAELVAGFPSSDGWYKVDQIYEIPVGNQVSERDPGARRLVRGGEWVGPIVRDYGLQHFRWDVVFQDIPGKKPFGQVVVIVESPFGSKIVEGLKRMQ